MKSKVLILFLLLSCLILAGVYLSKSMGAAGFESDYSKIRFEGQNALGEPNEKDVANCITNSSKDYKELGSSANSEHFNFLCRCVKSNTSQIKTMSDGFIIHGKCRAWTEKYFNQSNLFYTKGSK